MLVEESCVSREQVSAEEKRCQQRTDVREQVSMEENRCQRRTGVRREKVSAENRCQRTGVSGGELCQQRTGICRGEKVSAEDAVQDRFLQSTLM